MEIKNKIELTLEKYEKCFAVCDVDCPLGQLYDFTCALQSFVTQKMKEAEDARKPVESTKPKEDS